MLRKSTLLFFKVLVALFETPISGTPDAVSHRILHCLTVGHPLDSQVVRA